MFVTFEGVDGSGKTTQAELLHAFLVGAGRRSVATREPGGTQLGEAVREILLGGLPMSPWAEVALFAAARAELVEEVIRPALAAGADVVCDRYVDSSLAYQGVARGLGVEAVLDVNVTVTGSLLPDRTFVLLVAGDESARRLGGERDRIEREGGEFSARVEQGYRELAERYPERIVALDGSRARESIAEEVREHVRDLL